MVSVMHKEIMHSREFINNIGEEDIQKFMGTNVFFHDRLIEKWMRMCEYDVISREFNCLFRFSNEKKHDQRIGFIFGKCIYNIRS